MIRILMCCNVLKGYLQTPNCSGHFASWRMTYAAAALCRARQWQQSLALLSTVPECRAQLGSTLVAFSAGVLWANALLLLRSSRRSRSSEPDAGAVAAVLGACGAARRWEQCLELLEEMCDRRVEMNLACYTEAVLASGIFTTGLFFQPAAPSFSLPSLSFLFIFLFIYSYT